MAQNINTRMANAFVGRKLLMGGNTAVIVSTPPVPGERMSMPTVVEMMLYGTKIASWCPELGSFYTTCAGYNTVTTRARLDALIIAMSNMSLFELKWYRVKKGQLHWGDELITDTKSLQWHGRPTLGKTHPGFKPYYPGETGPEHPVSAPVPEELTFIKNMEVLL